MSPLLQHIPHWTCQCLACTAPEPVPTEPGRSSEVAEETEAERRAREARRRAEIARRGQVPA